MFLNLESLEGFSSLNLSNYNLIKDKNSNNKDGTYGILVDKMNILDSVNFNANSENILVVIANTEHRQAVLNTIKLFTNNK